MTSGKDRCRHATGGGGLIVAFLPPSAKVKRQRRHRLRWPLAAGELGHLTAGAHAVHADSERFSFEGRGSDAVAEVKRR